MEQERYPHLSAEKIRDFKSIYATQEQITRADQASKKEIDEKLRRCILNNDDRKERSGGPHIKVAVIGTSGSGKSATANTLLQEKKFHESTSAISQGTEAGPYTSKLLTVVDTSGSWKLPKVTTDISRIQLYILVINMASPRFGRENLRGIQSLKDYNNIIKSKRCLVLLTHASDALKGKSLYEYVSEIKGDPLYDLIMKDMEGCRVMAINNNCDTKYEADKQHEMIVNVLERTYENANLNADNNNCFMFCSLVVLAFIVIFRVISLSVWYTNDVPPAMMSTTMEHNMTTETTADQSST